MKKAKSQNDLVYDYLKENKSITSMDAIMHLNVTRLAARIADLRAAGVDIRADRQRIKKKDGSNVTFTRYYLGGVKQ